MRAVRPRPQTPFPVRLIGTEVRLRTDDGRLLVIMTGTGEVIAEHVLVARGGEGVLRARPGRRGVHHRGRRGREHPALQLELAELGTLRAAHGEQAFLAALHRAVAFCR